MRAEDEAWQMAGRDDEDEDRVEDEDEDEDAEDEEEEDEEDEDWDDEDGDWDDDEESALRIAIADDEEEARDELIAALEEDEYEITDLGEGDDLAEYLRGLAQQGDEGEYPSLLVISDGAAGENALEILAEFRRSDWSTPIVLIGGSEAFADEAERLGLTLVDRPSDPQAFRETIRGLLENG